MLGLAVYLVYNINIYFVCICVHFNCSPFHLGGGGGESMSVGVSNMSALAVRASNEGPHEGS